MPHNILTILSFIDLCEYFLTTIKNHPKAWKNIIEIKINFIVRLVTALELGAELTILGSKILRYYIVWSIQLIFEPSRVQSPEQVNEQKICWMNAGKYRVKKSFKLLIAEVEKTSDRTRKRMCTFTLKLMLKTDTCSLWMCVLWLIHYNHICMCNYIIID